MTTVSIVNPGGKGVKNVAESPCSTSHSAYQKRIHTRGKHPSGSQGWVETFVIWLIKIYRIVSNLEGAWLIFHINYKSSAVEKCWIRWLEALCSCCAWSTPSAVMGLFPHAAPYSSPDLVGISAGKGGQFSFQRTNFFMRPRCFHSIWVARLQRCSLIHIVLPTSSTTGSQGRVFGNLKKKKKNPYKICQKWKRTRAPYRVSMNGYATKLGTGNTEIVESVQSLTKLNYIFKWSPPLHPKIESSMIYHGCHNSIWGQFLPLWPQDQNNFVLGTITVLKWQSCPQDPHHLLRWLLKHTTAFLTHFTHDQGPCKVKPQPHRERLAPHAHHIQFCFFLISCKDAFYLPFPTMRVFSYWEQKGG